MLEKWLSIVEYARAFQVSDMTVRRRIKTGKLHAVLKEGKYYIPVPSQQQAQEHQQQQHQQQQQQQKRAANEMQVIKGHPQAHKTYVQPPAPSPMPMAPMSSPMPQPHVMPMQREAVQAFDLDHESDSVIPASLRRPFSTHDTTVVDSRALLAFCEATLRKINETERRTIERFKSKLEAVEANVVAKDHEIKSLRQQVEDLQLLVKILEKKKHG